MNCTIWSNVGLSYTKVAFILSHLFSCLFIIGQSKNGLGLDSREIP